MLEHRTTRQNSVASYRRNIAHSPVPERIAPDYLTHAMIAFVIVTIVLMAMVRYAS